ncbi:MAG: hypothetical protein AAGA63_09950 [Pseudomonadota bacterium]
MGIFGDTSAATLAAERNAKEDRSRYLNMKMAREGLDFLSFEQALQVMAQFIEEHPQPRTHALRCFAQSMDRHVDDLERRS